MRYSQYAEGASDVIVVAAVLEALFLEPSIWSGLFQLISPLPLPFHHNNALPGSWVGQ
jgi:hypothetical protein